MHGSVPAFLAPRLLPLSSSARLNVTHVPLGCATWPAFWTVTEDLDNWPTGGEIDILENANDEWNGARTSLHTKDSCTIPARVASQSGVVAYTNCSAYTPENTGCTTEMNGTSTPSWGAQFNAQGGGIVAMERSLGSTGNGVRVWYWRHGEEPSNVARGSQSVDTSTWGQPGADFHVADTCHGDFGKHKVRDSALCLGGELSPCSLSSLPALDHLRHYPVRRSSSQPCALFSFEASRAPRD